MLAKTVRIKTCEVKRKSASGEKFLTQVVHRGFAANDPNVHRGCSDVGTYDASGQILYNYFRYYDPKIGKYITADPIGLEGGANLYAYVAGNPINFIDPYGLWNISVFGCAGLHCISGNFDGAEHQFGPPTLGGGLNFCTDEPEPDDCDKNDPNKNEGKKGATIGKFGIGFTYWEDGTRCISIGPHSGFPGPVVNGGDATVH